MVKTQKRRRSSHLILKPRGTFNPRVQKVGPEHFGIVSVDCAKARSKWMLADFYGNVLIPPTVVEHNRADCEATVARLRQAMQERALHDVLVAVERTGRYHHVILNALAAAGLDVRVVHPFATQQFRLPADPGYKTDDTDLAAIHRAAVNGFALQEVPQDPSWTQLQLLARHRRNWVRKASTLCCQIRESLHAALPGYAACFESLWASQIAFPLFRRIRTAADVQQAGREGLSAWLKEDQVRFQKATLDKLLAWAATAPAGDSAAEMHHRIALALEDDRERKEREIRVMERDLAARLARTPYVRLLSIPGINVVSAAEYAGEMGPITNYAHPKNITGRAGLCPSRAQSDQVDRPDGRLRRCANRTLRFAILQIADNLIACNAYFGKKAAAWKAAGKDARHIRVCVGSRFVRISYALVAGGQFYHHPLARDRSYLLEKLMTFHVKHETPMDPTLADLQATILHVPRSEYAAEAAPLRRELDAIEQDRRRGPQPLGKILPLVLARLGIAVQSGESGARDLT